MNRFRWPVSVLPATAICITINLLVGLVSVDGNSCHSDTHTAGWTSPHGDIVLREGADLEIFCHLDPQDARSGNYSSAQIFFTRNDNSASIPPSNVFIVNETTAVLRIKNMPLLNGWFCCKLAVDESINNRIEPPGSSLELPSTSAPNGILACCNAVSIGTKPKEVENFSCISYNWKVLTCSWSVPDNEVKTNYTIQYSIPKRAGRNMIYKCPTRSDTENNSCSWNSNSHPSYRNNFEYLLFTVNGRNIFGSSSQNFDFHHYAYILPDAPLNLSAVGKTCSSIFLQWNIDELHLFERGWKYNITYRREASDTWISTIYEPKTSIGEIVKFNVTGLPYPNALYHFRVYMKSSVAPINGPWSEPAKLVIKTEACRPYVSPRTDSGSFEIAPSSTKQPSRYVYVYWQPISPIEYNGEDFQYEIDVFEEGKKVELKPLQMKNSYARFGISLKPHTFVIWSANKEGRAPSGSVVQVPSELGAIKPPEILSKIDYGNNVYELSWKMPDIGEGEIVNYTMYWCETNKEYLYQCDSYIDWVNLPASVNKHNITVINSSSSYQFAVSANTLTYSSGMVWAACTVRHDRVSKIKNVWVDKIGSYYAVIRWKLECSERIDSIMGYYIYYCVTDPYDKSRCSGPVKTAEALGGLDTVSYNITGLEPFKYYRISMSMFTRNNTGLPSEALVNRTLDGPPDISDIVPVRIAETNTSITIRWARPNVTNGQLQYYVISYNQLEHKARANETEAVLSNLTSYENYQIKLKACTIECSPWTPAISVRTKIGRPGVVGPVHQSKNATHVVISWGRPVVPAGPQPRYRVRIRWDGADNETKERLTTDNSMPLDLSNCRSGGAYAVDVRAENVDESQVFEGEWLHALSQYCSSSSGLSTTWKVMIGLSLLLLIASIFAFWGKKGLYRCQQMKKVEVTLPAKFTIPPLFPVDSKECELFEPTKSVEEFYTLVDKTTELSLISSQT